MIQSEALLSITLNDLSVSWTWTCVKKDLEATTLRSGGNVMDWLEPKGTD